MNDRVLEKANGWMEVIKKYLEELRWQKHLTVLPNKFFKGDARREVLLYLAYVVDDTYDYGYLGYTPREMAQMLRDISDAILDSTESEAGGNLPEDNWPACQPGQ